MSQAPTPMDVFHAQRAEEVAERLNEIARGLEAEEHKLQEAREYHAEVIRALDRDLLRITRVRKAAQPPEPSQEKGGKTNGAKSGARLHGPKIGEERLTEIIGWMRQQDGEFTKRDVARAHGLNESTVGDVLVYLRAQGVIRHAGRAARAPGQMGPTLAVYRAIEPLASENGAGGEN